jgi:hypothetical protein
MGESRAWNLALLVSTNRKSLQILAMKDEVEIDRAS